MLLFVGLGNPGSKYDGTRHNLGFDALTLFSKQLERNSVQLKVQKKFQGLLAEGNLPDFRKLYLLLPQTYMNLSGSCVRDVLQFYKIPLKDCIVVFDDLDLEPATVRLRLKGGAGGHRGMRSTIEALGSEEFPRIRIGIGKPEREAVDSYVLGKIPKNEQPRFEEALSKCADAMHWIIEKGFESAMNRFN